jgi:hypothetical protein
MALIGPTFPPFKMPALEAQLDPASRSVVARLRILAWVVWLMWSVAGLVCGVAFAINALDASHGPTPGGWYRFALVVVVICSGAVGSFIGYLNMILIDWARQVLVVLGQIANRRG